jgi:hypothetical protein
MVSLSHGQFVPLLEDPVKYPAVGEPRELYAGDLNGDTYNDIVAIDFTSGANVIAVLINNGDGSFGLPAAYPVGTEPVGVIAADLDGANGPDMAVVNRDSDDLSILFNNGDGTFQSAVVYAVGDYPVSIDAADIDDDNDIDLVAGCHNLDGVVILFNNGDGTYTTSNFLPSGTGVSDVALSEMNGDMKIDLAVTNSADKTISVFWGVGDGTFTLSDNYNIGIPADELRTIDVDGDTDIDMAAGRFNGGIFLINAGDGTFTQHDSTFFCKESFTINDFDCNGLIDYSWTAEGRPDGDGIVAVSLLNFGEFTNEYFIQLRLAMSDKPYNSVATDVDLDGDPDLVVGVLDSIEIWMNKTLPVTCGDANNDGNVDVGDAVYLVAYIFTGGYMPWPLDNGDANCDGSIDIGDAVYIINYVFRGGPAPCCP